MMMALYKEATEVIEVIESNGFEAYLVGGCVRDALLQHPIQDIDIATSATPHDIIDLFPSVIPVGIDHGTVIVRHKGVSYEVTTFRHEGTYSDNRRPDQVEYIRDIKKDLARRDFTMNALAMDKNGEILDFYSGKTDIAQKRIRTVGNAEDRFKEDALRIMRALRFSSQLGFAISENTVEQMSRLCPLLEHISVERLTVECTKFFQGVFIENGMNYLRKTNIMAYLPVFKQKPCLIKQLFPKSLSAFISFPEVIAFCHYKDPSIAVTDWIREWKCSNLQKKDALELVAAVKRYEHKGLDNWLVYRLKQHNWSSFIHLLELLFPAANVTMINLRMSYLYLPIYRKQEIAIDGHEVSTLFPNFKNGPWLGQLLKRLEQKIVMGELTNEKTKLKEWILCHPPG
jgi:tRNA nucleotidyltransferase (CCA-adding enzyme)